MLLKVMISLSALPSFLSLLSPFSFCTAPKFNLGIMPGFHSSETPYLKALYHRLLTADTPKTLKQGQIKESHKAVDKMVTGGINTYQYLASFQIVSDDTNTRRLLGGASGGHYTRNLDLESGVARAEYQVEECLPSQAGGCNAEWPKSGKWKFPDVGKTVGTTVTNNKYSYAKEVFASRPDDVIAMRLTCSAQSSKGKCGGLNMGLSRRMGQV